MDERNEPTLGPPARLRVDQLESGLLETRHLGSDLLRREGEMMKSLPTTLDEPSNHAVGFEGFQEFDSNGPGAEESHADALRRHVFREVRLESQTPVVLERLAQASHGDAHVMDRSDHTSCLGLYVPKTVRRTSLISPSVAFARTESRIAGTRFASDRASSSKRWRWESTSPWRRFARNARTCRMRSGSRRGFVFGRGTLSSPSAYAFTPTTIRSPRSSSTCTRYAESAIWRWTHPVSIALSMPPRRSVSRIRPTASDSSRSVSDSIANEPATGSTVLATPLSCAKICWVLRATRTAFSDGSESASSMLFVWSDWAPPRTAARAWIATRTALFSGCCAVSATPAVWAWNRSSSDSGFLAWNRSLMMVAQSRRAARNLATSSSKSMCALKKNEICGAIASTSRPRDTAASRYAIPFAMVNPISWAAVAPASRMW